MNKYVLGALLFAALAPWYLPMLVDLCHPTMPIATTVRDGLSGKVVNITSNSQAELFLYVDMEVYAFDGHVKQKGTLCLVSSWSGDQGWLQGWNIESGDRVWLRNEQYRDRLVWVW